MNKTVCYLCRAAFFLFLLVPFSFGSDFQRLKDDEIIALPSKEKVVLINFWATWCQPCQAEIPALNRLQKKHSSISFIGVNLDAPENRGAIRGFLKKHPIDYEIYLRDGTDFEALMAAFDRNWKAGIPATFVYKEGKQIFSKLGAITEDELEAVLAKNP